MRILRTIRYLFIRFVLRKNLPSPYYGYEQDSEDEQGPRLTARRAIGSVYHEIQFAKERARVFESRREAKGKEDKIAWEILGNSRSILKRLLALCFLSSVIDYCCLLLLIYLQRYGFIQNIPGAGSTVRTFLGIVIGALSAILGVIVALYVVGIQLQQKYSPKVADYINQEPVINYFFELLVLADTFSIFLFLRTGLYVSPPLFSIPFIEIPLLILSLVGILVMKSHYTRALKPRNLVDRISKELKKNVELISNRNSSLFESWSVVTRCREQAQSLLVILDDLRKDLSADARPGDIAYMPFPIAFVMNFYTSRSHFIDRERGWWFPAKLNEVQYGDSTTTTMKLNYELRGLGPLRTTTSNLTWFSDEIRKLLRKITTDAANRDAILNTIYAYETILYGQHNKDKYGHYKKDRFGAFERQEMQIFEDFFTDFCNLFEKVDMSNHDEYAAYLNTFFYVGTALINGFDYKTDEFEKLRKTLIGPNQKIAIKKKMILDMDIPTIFKNTLIDYFDKLEVEQICEGRVVTPKEWAENEILEIIKDAEREYYKKYFGMLVTHHNKMLAYLQGDAEKYYEVFKIKFAWISRCLFVEKSEYAEEYSDKLLNFNTSSLPSITKETIEQKELIEEIEKTIFPAVLEQKRNLSKKLSGIIIFFLKTLSGDPKNPDPEALYTKLRLIVILGGFIYLVSEFEQKKEMLADYAELLENSFSREQLVVLLKLLEDPGSFGGKNLALRLIDREISRYHHWFGRVAQKIGALPKTYGEVLFYSGLQEVADHPSKFIREISHGFFPYEEKCIKKFIEYMIGRLKTKLENAKTK